MNKVIMRCYFKSDLSNRRCRKRMMANVNNSGLFQITGQRLADQVKVIKTDGLPSALELVEMKRAGQEAPNGQSDEVHTEEVIENRNENIEPENENVNDNKNRSGSDEENDTREADQDLRVDKDADLSEAMIDKMPEYYNNGITPLKVNFKNIQRSKLDGLIAEINKCLNTVKTGNITETNKLIAAVSPFPAEVLQLKRNEEEEEKEGVTVEEKDTERHRPVEKSRE